MKLAWLFILAFLTAAPNPTQGPIIGEFSKSPTEHIIIQMDQPFVVRSVKGVTIRTVGGEPLTGVLFEIQGPGTEKKIRHAQTNEQGQFRIGNVPIGIYKFKTTLNGFQSVMGTISVSKQAPKTNEIKIEIPVGA